MKRCTGCQEEKPETAEFFHRRARVKSGFRDRCKPCRSNAAREFWSSIPKHERSKICRNRHERQSSEALRKFEATYARKYPEKTRARSSLIAAVRSGKIKRPDKCWMCQKGCKPEGHHHKGYSEEHMLDVLWLCLGCHRELHSARTVHGVSNRA